MDPELRKAITNLLDSIDDMKAPEQGRHWYGGFSDGNQILHSTYQIPLTFVEWPNLAICADELRRLLYIAPDDNELYGKQARQIQQDRMEEDK
jgi:hypothetical protein